MRPTPAPRTVRHGRNVPQPSGPPEPPPRGRRLGPARLPVHAGAARLAGAARPADLRPRPRPPAAASALGPDRAGLPAEHLAGLPPAGAGIAARGGGGGGNGPDRQRRTDRQVARAAAIAPRGRGAGRVTPGLYPVLDFS